mgnify:CR=1 FL=1
MNITKKKIDDLNAVVTVEISKEDYDVLPDAKTRRRRVLPAGECCDLDVTLCHNR